jgi:hypothetical protein
LLIENMLIFLMIYRALVLRERLLKILKAE